MIDDENEALIRELFDTVDLDSSGYIDQQELAAVVDLNPDDLKEIFNQLDSDKDGKISIEEFIENYKQFQNIADQNLLLNVQENKTNNNDISNISTTLDISRQSPTQIIDQLPSSKERTYTTGYSRSSGLNRPKRLRLDVKRKAARYLGQEYLDDLYEVARSRNDPMLIESLENFLTATVDNLLQKQSENEKLDTALKRATEKNSEIVYELEHEMEQQVAMLESKIREEERMKLEQQKNEANFQILRAQQELNEMEEKVKSLEEKVTEKVSEIPDSIINVIQKKDEENEVLQKKLLEFQTQMALMRTEVANMKAEYDEQANRLTNERGTVLTCVQEQENLTRQLHLLHEANRKLHDTNDDLRSALDSRRTQSLSHSFSMSSSPVKKLFNTASPIKRPSLASSFRSDPGTYNLLRKKSSTVGSGNSDFNDTDDDTKHSSVLPLDEDISASFVQQQESVNNESLLTEIMAADGNVSNYGSPMYNTPARGSRTPESSFVGTPVYVSNDREQFVRQLEILCDTNRRLGESNDELRQALGILSDRLRHDKPMSDLPRPSPTGAQSCPVTPMRNKLQTEVARPQSTSSPRKVLLTKSGYHSSMPDLSSDVLNIETSNNKEGAVVQSDMPIIEKVSVKESQDTESAPPQENKNNNKSNGKIKSIQRQSMSSSFSDYSMESEKEDNKKSTDNNKYKKISDTSTDSENDVKRKTSGKQKYKKHIEKDNKKKYQSSSSSSSSSSSDSDSDKEANNEKEANKKLNTSLIESKENLSFNTTLNTTDGTTQLDGELSEENINIVKQIENNISSDSTDNSITNYETTQVSLTQDNITKDSTSTTNDEILTTKIENKLLSQPRIENELLSEQPRNELDESTYLEHESQALTNELMQQEIEESTFFEDTTHFDDTTVMNTTNFDHTTNQYDQTDFTHTKLDDETTVFPETRDYTDDVTEDDITAHEASLEQSARNIYKEEISNSHTISKESKSLSATHTMSSNSKSLLKDFHISNSHGGSLKSYSTDHDSYSYTQTKLNDSGHGECECGNTILQPDFTLCDDCFDNDTDVVVEDISFDDTSSVYSVPSATIYKRADKQKSDRSEKSGKSNNNDISIQCDLEEIPLEQLDESNITELNKSRNLYNNMSISHICNPRLCQCEIQETTNPLEKSTQVSDYMLLQTLEEILPQFKIDEESSMDGLLEEMDKLMDNMAPHKTPYDPPNSSLDTSKQKIAIETPEKIPKVIKDEFASVSNLQSFNEPSNFESTHSSRSYNTNNPKTNNNKQYKTLDSLQATSVQVHPSTKDNSRLEVSTKDKTGSFEISQLAQPANTTRQNISQPLNKSSLSTKAPVNYCRICQHVITIHKTGLKLCLCTDNNNDDDTFINKSINQLPESVILTDSDSNNYSDQEIPQSPLKRVRPVGSETEQDATYETNFGLSKDVSWMSGMTSTYSVYHHLEAELSMFARRQPDEDLDEDDMDDEELIRIVDQTNPDDEDYSASVTDEPITVEEKILEPRGSAVGADTSDDVSRDNSLEITTTSKQPDRMFKLVLAGNAAVGKSSFIIRLCKDKFYSALNSTLGVDFQMRTMNVDGSNVALQLWDTAGQERFRSIAKSYFRRVDGVVLLYDVTCENSFLDVRDWLDSIQSSSSKDIPIIICGNKVDLRPYAMKRGMPVVSRNQGERMAKEVGALFIETSAKDGINVNKACFQLARKLSEMDSLQSSRQPDNGITLDKDSNSDKAKKSGCCK